MAPTRDTTHPNEAAFPSASPGLRFAHWRMPTLAAWLTHAAFGGGIARATRHGPRRFGILKSALAQKGRHLRKTSELSDARGEAFHRVPTYRPVRRFSSHVQPVSSCWWCETRVIKVLPPQRLKRLPCARAGVDRFSQIGGEIGV